MSDSHFVDLVSAYIKDHDQLSKTVGTDNWVVFAKSKFQKAFREYCEAFEYAENLFGDDTYLIRNVHAETPVVPLVVARA